MIATKKHSGFTWWHWLPVADLGNDIRFHEGTDRQRLTPVDIFFYRFVLAYLCIRFISPKRLLADTVADECWLAGAGFCGGALYFVTENMALGLTLVSNVSLIVCISPLLTAFLVILFYRNEKVRKTLLAGSVMALAGVAFVVFNGHFILKLSPAGDLLTVAAAFSWAFTA